MASHDDTWWTMRSEAGGRRVELHGEFDITTTPGLRHDYGQLGHRAGEPAVFDLRDVVFADSSLAHFFEEVRADAGAGAGAKATTTVEVQHESPALRLLELCGVAQAITVLTEDDTSAPG